jgi:hypothetical protein
MSTMDQPPVIQLDQNRRMARAMNARRRLSTAPDRRDHVRSAGRAWLNGRELGGTRLALTHLTETYD